MLSHGLLYNQDFFVSLISERRLICLSHTNAFNFLKTVLSMLHILLNCIGVCDYKVSLINIRRKKKKNGKTMHCLETRKLYQHQ